ncbi:MAG: endonuclease domain-containing protein [Hyphomonas sp.]|uniref:endonuclease domain-containing protein n=1 Tax=Hyphomonas sp. TaxID=87 RepID=UPI0035289AD7
MTRSPSIHRARKLRQMANTPEQVVWQTLRNLRKHGFPVRRQHPVGGYIVDFAIVSVQMAIEIDGSVHGREDVAISDATRQADLEQMGWRVLRLSAQEAMDAEYLWARVCEALEI